MYIWVVSLIELASQVSVANEQGVVSVLADSKAEVQHTLPGLLSLGVGRQQYLQCDDLLISSSPFRDYARMATNRKVPDSERQWLRVLGTLSESQDRVFVAQKVLEEGQLGG